MVDVISHHVHGKNGTTEIIRTDPDKRLHDG